MSQIDCKLRNTLQQLSHMTLALFMHYIQMSPVSREPFHHLRVSRVQLSAGWSVGVLEEEKVLNKHLDTQKTEGIAGTERERREWEQKLSLREGWDQTFWWFFFLSLTISLYRSHPLSLSPACCLFLCVCLFFHFSRSLPITLSLALALSEVCAVCCLIILSYTEIWKFILTCLPLTEKHVIIHQICVSFSFLFFTKECKLKALSFSPLWSPSYHICKQNSIW